MLIHEAILATDKEHPLIKRTSWDQGGGYPWPTPQKILPTNGPNCCIFYGIDAPEAGWTPRKDDLTADDWVTARFPHGPRRP